MRLETETLQQRAKPKRPRWENRVKDSLIDPVTEERSEATYYEGSRVCLP